MPKSVDEMSEIFNASKVDYESFIDGPRDVLADPRLVIRIDSQFYYDWKSAAPILMSYLVFKAPLPPPAVSASLN